MEKIIEVNNLSKCYGNVVAVQDVSFYVEKGKLFAFLGPNGAGKSTTINTICTFLKPDTGEITVNGYTLGKDDNPIKKSIGVVFQENLLDPLLTVKENLDLRGRFYYKDRKKRHLAVNHISEITEITDVSNRQYGRLSGGQKRRVDIARALLHTPQVLFLDEPTTGLDPQTRRNVWETIKKLQAEQSMTVFLTTHYMEEADDADYCIIIDEGKVVAKGTPFDLKDQHARDKLKMKPENRAKLTAHLTQHHIPFQEKADIIEVMLHSTKQALPILNQAHAYIESFTVEKGAMDDVFINITGKEIRE